MTPERWQQVARVYQGALEQDPAARAAYLAETCRADAELRREVESLLAQASASVLVDRPVWDAAAGLMEPSRDLVPGTVVGPYRVGALLGVGGMGQVYRAHDTKLQREVALKILPEAFADDPDRLARFRREAHVLASLNHPNIAAIHGFEDSGPVHALVLEFVDGPTLADRIARGPVPLDDALAIARQIAEALEAAHEHGVIHRDLKPANIKLRPDGTVKVLDFGLAKALAPEPGSAAAGPLSQSPTITSPAMMTGIGMILGTAAYMAPEQAKGRPADKRSDLWAFGCVLYEVLTGRRAFEGDDVSDTLANVLKSEPDWSVLPSATPGAVRTLLRRCLTKDRKKRLDSAAGARLEIDDALTMPASDADAVSAGARSVGWRRSVALTAGALAVAAVATTLTWLATRPAPPRVVRTTITTSGSAALTLQGFDRDIAITPDGSRVVYRGDNQLLVRALNQLEPTVLSGLGAPRGPFISPDGQWVGFFDGTTTMKKVAITGGPPETLCAIEGNAAGAAWGPDGTIIFATDAPATGLQRVSATGGTPTVLTTPDRERGERDHALPELLPGGEAVLFTIYSASNGIDNAQVAVLDLRTGTSRVLIRGATPHYVPTGHLVYSVPGTLRAVAFDLERLEVIGTPAPVLEGIVTSRSGAAHVAVAGNGSLVYVPGTAGGARQTVVSVDRQGRASPLPGLPLDAYRDVRVSPDGARLALATFDDVWVYDIARGTVGRLTTDPARDRSPLWTPDGQRIIFTSTRAGYPELFWRPADGTGRDERLVARGKDLVDLYAAGWSADRRQLLFTELPPSIQCAIGQIAIERPSDARVLVKSAFCNASPTVSPDGRWIAYASTVSGKYEIYIERYPELGSRQQISTAGGRLAVWSRDGRELFFGSLDGRQMLAVPVQSGTTLVAGRPRVLFEFAMLPIQLGARPYDITPDGRFVIIRSGQAEGDAVTASNMIVVQNWFEELKRLVPTK